ncbi:MAG TPA: phosphoenolpyruvate--protein phosphotransferase [Mobilitalea sp.]|nr:phosphoenolpyruvate--protein phosphotransferase [Mobilitalea sp.]
MITLTGKSVYQDICIGKIHFFKKKNGNIKRYHVEDTKEEISRFDKAREEAVSQLQALYEKALIEAGEANAAIFEVHQMMLEDEDYYESVGNIINTQKVNAEFAVGVTSDNFSNMFAAMEDAYMQGRAADIRDISDRLINILSGVQDEAANLTEPVIIAADDLLPSETVKLDKSKVLGFAIQYGSIHSHTAILARSMGIPALIGLGENFGQEYHGTQAILDGFTGAMYLEPDDETLAAIRQKQQELQAKKQLLQELKGKENITLDGKRIKVYANIGNVSDVGSALKNDAEGIGLFRSEFLYLENDDFPTEDQQFTAYKTVAENMAGKKVIIRTLDIGADKQADYFQLDKEENPALGYRAIRICLTRTEIFKTQLRAILRAALFGNISVMFPMIISLQEIKRIKTILEETKQELEKERIPFKADIETGIMIETPAAVLISDQLAKEVDFFSVGTNDLTQYTLAIDRQNQKLEEFYDPHHPAVLSLIQMSAENAHKEGKWIGICGELGADLEMTETFLKLGIDELSVSPGMILELRKKIRETDTTK